MVILVENRQFIYTNICHKSYQHYELLCIILPIIVVRKRTHVYCISCKAYTKDSGPPSQRSPIAKVPHRKRPPSQRTPIANVRHRQGTSSTNLQRLKRVQNQLARLMMNDYKSLRPLCSSTQFLLHQPRSASNFSSRSFNVAAPKIWSTYVPRGVPA